ncbi:Fic family protein [Microbacterium sp. CCNWLW41]|uniref:Fic family protein n=1 Tax=unclassified Microbacterium TaxID=2609290 RepID=UPI003FA56F15
MPALIEDLTAFARRTDVSPLVQTAVAHAQFETIHPFTDGNGRTGRALAQALLRHRGSPATWPSPCPRGFSRTFPGITRR